MTHEPQPSQREVALGGLRRVEGGVVTQRHSRDAAVVVAMDWKDPLKTSGGLDAGSFTSVGAFPEQCTQLKNRIDLVAARLMLPY